MRGGERGASIIPEAEIPDVTVPRLTVVVRSSRVGVDFQPTASVHRGDRLEHGEEGGSCSATSAEASKTIAAFGRAMMR